MGITKHGRGWRIVLGAAAIGLALLVLAGPFGERSDGRVHAQVGCFTDVDADIVMMLDRTRSMSSTDRANEEIAAKALLGFFTTASSPPKIGVGRFGDQTNGGVEAEVQTRGQLTNTEIPSPYGDDDAGADSDDDLYHAIEAATDSSSSVGTNLEDAVDVGQAELNSVRGTAAPNVLILVSDGDPNEPGSDSDAQEAALDAADAAKLANTEIFTIHFGSGPSGFAGQELLAAMASGAATPPSPHDAHGHETGSADDQISDAAENADGDHFFIAPSGSGLEAIFLQIGEEICPEPETGTITIHKVVDDGAGTAAEFCFTLSPDPTTGEVCATDPDGDADPQTGAAIFSDVAVGN